MCNAYILRDPEYIDRFYINFSFHFVLEQNPSETDQLDNVVLRKEVVQQTKKPRSVGPHKSKPEKTISKKKKHKKNKKFRGVNIQIPKESRSAKMKTHEYTE